MEKDELTDLVELVRLTVIDLCYPFVTVTPDGIRVCVCEKEVTFTTDELIANRNSIKDFIGLLKKRIWEKK